MLIHVAAEPTTSLVTKNSPEAASSDCARGFEAGIVVMILVAVLVKSDRRDALKYVWLGVGLALLLLIVAFLGIQFGTSTIDSKYAELVAGVASLIAVAIVTYMLLWMSKASASISGDLKEGMAQALSTGPVAVFFPSLPRRRPRGPGDCTADGRLRRGVSGGLVPLIGLLIGIAVAVAITVGLYYGAVRINFRCSSRPPAPS